MLEFIYSIFYSFVCSFTQKKCLHGLHSTSHQQAFGITHGEELEGVGLVLTGDDVLRDADVKLEGEELVLMSFDVLKDEDVMLIEDDVIMTLEYETYAIQNRRKKLSAKLSFCQPG